METTKVHDINSIGLGLAELYIGDSASNIFTAVPTLLNEHYFSALSEIGFKASKVFVPISDTVGDVVVLIDKLLVKADFSIEATFIEFTRKNMSLSLGGEGTENNPLNALFAQASEKRVELVFTYPNKVDTMTIVLPRCKITTTSISGSFNSAEPFTAPIVITPLKVSSVAWESDPIGKMVFSKV